MLRSNKGDSFNPSVRTTVGVTGRLVAWGMEEFIHQLTSLKKGSQRQISQSPFRVVDKICLSTFRFRLKITRLRLRKLLNDGCNSLNVQL